MRAAGPLGAAKRAEVCATNGMHRNLRLIGGGGEDTVTMGGIDPSSTNDGRFQVRSRLFRFLLRPQFLLADVHLACHGHQMLDVAFDAFLPLVEFQQ